ncbi:AAA family ATPase [Sporosarcina gallistercoris]|uniref:AAA family ATPase n=1 Tax=Sporosarcina gallistercoris TaxID=2762245 RepID=A0ABR8PHQ6_9BACL|nr:AAA family ATPase [Sporosarcina gallistercoris]MBD7907716.1 AAA family ATPase [Sporosarcina gallistercoris]
MFLKKITLQNEKRKEEYPFTIPVIQSLKELELTNPVTYFVGENGSGKSTLLEGVADVCGFNPAGGGRNNQYEVDAAGSDLSEYLRLSWMPKVTNGFFLRAESFYQFASHVDQVGSYNAYGGISLHQQSHGESFMSLFLNRFNGRALYLLDEPEAALSPQRQLTFLRIIHKLVEEKNCQFIIATHSPILLGYPGASILSFDEEEIHAIDYEQTHHYQVTKYFLDHRQKFLKDLFEEG